MRGAAFTLAQASRIAAKRFGVRALRPEQRRALEAVAAGRDVLVVQPTGSGKSLDYQLAAMLLPGKAVSPSTLALSAQVTTASARAVLATLLERGLLSRDGETYRLAISTAEFVARSRDLIRRFEILRREDRRRIEAVRDYAEQRACRSLVLRRYFGEQNPPVCGQCDTCRSEARRHRAESTGSYSSPSRLPRSGTAVAARTRPRSIMRRTGCTAPPPGRSAT